MSCYTDQHMTLSTLLLIQKTVTFLSKTSISLRSSDIYQQYVTLLRSTKQQSLLSLISEHFKNDSQLFFQFINIYFSPFYELLKHLFNDIFINKRNEKINTLHIKDN